jgi:hypothetical protein
MKGFAVKSPKHLHTIYKILVRNSSGLTSKTSVVRMPGQKADTEEIKGNDVSVFANPATYTGLTTPLAEVISNKSNENSTLYILTDGIESENKYLRLQESMAQLAGKGWGIWVLLFPMDFDGSLDIEQPIIPEVHIPEINKCIQAEDPGWQVTVKPGASRSIGFKGRRGLLLFILTQDVGSGRKQVELLANDLKAELNKTEIVELAPLYPRRYTVDKAEPQSLGIDVVSGENHMHRIVADPENGEAFKELRLGIKWVDPPAVFPQPVTESWVLNKELPDWSDLKILKSDTGPGGLTMAVNADRSWIEWLWSFVSSKPSIRSAPLTFSVSSGFTPIEGGWWQQWSGDTTWRCPQKVFMLNGLVTGVAEAARQRHIENPSKEQHNFILQVGLD